MHGTSPAPNPPARAARRKEALQAAAGGWLRGVSGIGCVLSGLLALGAATQPGGDGIEQHPARTRQQPTQQQPKRPSGPKRLVVDPKLPRYRPTEGVSGSISSVGSDTMSNLMTYWAEQFRRFYPAVQFEVTGKGSGHAPPALIRGAATFGPMSRAMKSKELDTFESRFGYQPVQLQAAVDMLAVFVHRDNPIAEVGLTLEQVDAIFSSTRRGGMRPINTWGDLGLAGAWADQPISLYGRNAASGTYGYFKAKALFGGDFRNEVKEQPGSSSVVSGIANDRYGIGYSGIGYNTADVRPVPLAKTRTGKMVLPAAEQVTEYPLTRFLFLSVNHRPNSRLDPLRAAFIQLIYSREGQAAAIKAGFLPVPALVAQRNLARVGLGTPQVTPGSVQNGK